MENRKIMVIGSDSSHITAFANLIQNKKAEWGWEISWVIRHDESKMPISVNRREKVEEQIRELGIPILSRLDGEVAEKADAFIIGNVDAEFHKPIFEKIAPYQKPVFIDKPIAYSIETAAEIFNCAAEKKVPLFSCSSLRFAASFAKLAKELTTNQEWVQYAVLRGPLTFLPEVPDFYWYGIHLIEMMQTIEKGFCRLVSMKEEEGQLSLHFQGNEAAYQLIGDLSGEASFSGEIVTEEGNFSFDITEDTEPLYVYLLIEMLRFFESKRPPVSPEDTMDVIRMVAAADNEQFLRKERSRL